MIKKQRGLRFKDAANEVLVRMWLNTLALLPSAMTLVLVAGVVMLSVLALADLACTEPKNWL